MSFASYIAALIAGAITIPALVALYFLKLRRRQVAVPSTLLWQKAIQDMQVNTPFQRLRRNLLLLLQLLILAALLLAFAGPRLWASSEPGQRVVILIDRSASMRASAEAGGPSRFERAREAAQQVIDNLATGGNGQAPQVMVVAYADRPHVQANFSADPARLRRAIDAIEPTDQLSRLGPALALIEPYAQRAAASQQGKLTVHVITDGRVHRENNKLPSLSGASFNYVQVASSPPPDNLAIVAASARRPFEKPDRVQLFTRLANFSSQPVTTNLTLNMPGRTPSVQRVTVPPAGRRATGLPENIASPARPNGDREPNNDVTFQPGTRSVQFAFRQAAEGLVTLSHDHEDALAADNTAQLTLAPAKRLRALLVTTGNPFLKRVIESVGVRTLVTIGPDQYAEKTSQSLTGGSGSGESASERGFDVVIFDNVAPKTLPPVPSVSFGAVPPIEGLARKRPDAASQAGQVILDWQRDHPMMRYVQLSEVVIAEPSWLALPSEATVLATAQRGPVIAEVQAKGRRHVVTSFPVLESNWPMQVSFPVFVANTLQQLGLGGLRGEAGIAYRTGETAAIPVAGAQGRITYQGPATLTAEVADHQAVVGPFTETGVYQTDAAVEPPYTHLGVNLLDANESDLRPLETLQIAGNAIPGKASAQAIQKPIWPWFVIAALGVLVLEWLVYTYRMRV